MLLVLAVWFAWRPAETHPWSAILPAAAVVALSAWSWRKTSAATAQTLVVGAAAVALLLATGLLGWDPSEAVNEFALLAAVVSLVWLASREAPPDQLPTLLAVSISLLALWGVWQIVVGFDDAITQMSAFPELMRAAAAERLTSGRAFASQILPSHLAVLLATALPLLLVRIKFRWSSSPQIVSLILCAVGLILSRSPVGIGLAVAACTALTIGRRRLWMVAFTVALLAALMAVVLWRGDVRELEPVNLRLDNWRLAFWVWSTAPAAGVGPGGFAQAAQAVPFAVGNRPRHAHSLPLEWLAELGPAGLLASLMLAVALWRLVRALWSDRPELAVAVMVIPAHNLVDFSLYSSGVALPWAVLLGWAIAEHRGESASETTTMGRSVLVLAAALALALSVLHATSRTVGDAAVLRASPEERLAGALEARRLAPWRVQPLGLAAMSALHGGDPDLVSAAARELDRARWLRPRSAALAGLRARLAVALGEGPTALSEAWTANQEQPSNSEFRRYLDGVLLELDNGTGRAGD
jgi:hypothetical protein